LVSAVGRVLRALRERALVAAAGRGLGVLRGRTPGGRRPGARGRPRLSRRRAGGRRVLGTETGVVRGVRQTGLAGRRAGRRAVRALGMRARVRGQRAGRRPGQRCRHVGVAARRSGERRRGRRRAADPTLGARHRRGSTTRLRAHRIAQVPTLSAIFHF